jgi:hypothetical protein
MGRTQKLKQQKGIGHLVILNDNLASIILRSPKKSLVVYGGDRRQRREHAEVVSWNEIEILCAGLAPE